MSKEENIVVRECYEFLNSLPNCFCWRANQIPVKGRAFIGLKGVSDLVGIYKGKFLGVEVKTTTGKLSPEQEFFMDKIIKMGGIAILARCKQDVINGLEGK